MPYDQRDDETRRFEQAYTDQDFFDAVRELEVAGSSEVADVVDCATDTARIRLDRLVDRGELEKREVGRRNVYFAAE